MWKIKRTVSLQELIQKVKKSTLEHDLLTYEILNCRNLKRIVEIELNF